MLVAGVVALQVLLCQGGRAAAQSDEPAAASSPWLSDQPSAAGAAAPATDMGALLKRLEALERRNESLEGSASATPSGP